MKKKKFFFLIFLFLDNEKNCQESIETEDKIVKCNIVFEWRER